MPLELRPVTGSDIPRLVEIEFDAYGKSVDSQLLRGRNRHDGSHWERAMLRYEDMLTGGMCIHHSDYTDIPVVFRKVIDTDQQDTPVIVPWPPVQNHINMIGQPNHDGKIVGWLRYEIHPGGLDWDHDLDRRFRPYQWPMHPAQLHYLVRYYWEMHEFDRRTMMLNEPHNYLCLVAVDPNHQQRGVGSMLLDGFCDEVDEDGLVSYCEASPAGYKLYQSRDFATQKDVRFPLKLLGFQGTRDHTCMIRHKIPQPPMGTFDVEEAARREESRGRASPATDSESSSYSFETGLPRMYKSATRINMNAPGQVLHEFLLPRPRLPRLLQPVPSQRGARLRSSRSLSPRRHQPHPERRPSGTADSYAAFATLFSRPRALRSRMLRRSALDDRRAREAFESQDNEIRDHPIDHDSSDGGVDEIIEPVIANGSNNRSAAEDTAQTMRSAPLNERVDSKRGNTDKETDIVQGDSPPESNFFDRTTENVRDDKEDTAGQGPLQRRFNRHNGKTRKPKSPRGE